MCVLTIFSGDNVLPVASVVLSPSLFLSCLFVLPPIIAAFFLLRWLPGLVESVDAMTSRATAKDHELRMLLLPNQADEYDAKKWADKMVGNIESRSVVNLKRFEEASEAIKSMGVDGFELSCTDENAQIFSSDAYKHFESQLYRNFGKKWALEIKWAEKTNFPT